MTKKMCHLVRDQMLKMLRVGAIEWNGFTPPVRAHTTDSPRPASSHTTGSPRPVDSHTTESPRISTPRSSSVTFGTQTNPEQHQPHTPVMVTTKSVGTSMKDIYHRHNPSPAWRTRQDVLIQKCLDAVERINIARVERKQRSFDEIIMLIQFVTRFIIKNNCSLPRKLNSCSAGSVKTSSTL